MLKISRCILFHRLSYSKCPNTKQPIKMYVIMSELFKYRVFWLPSLEPDFLWITSYWVVVLSWKDVTCGSKVPMTPCGDPETWHSHSLVNNNLSIMRQENQAFFFFKSYVNIYLKGNSTSDPAACRADFCWISSLNSDRSWLSFETFTLSVSPVDTQSLRRVM